MTTSVLVTTRSLPVKLTQEELLKVGGELAQTVQDIASEEDRATSLKSSIKARMAELEGRRTVLAIKVARQEEYRDVRVEKHFDGQRGIVQEIRTDSGEVIATRQMTDSERQMSLPVEELAKKGVLLEMVPGGKKDEQPEAEVKEPETTPTADPEF